MSDEYLKKNEKLINEIASSEGTKTEIAGDKADAPEKVSMKERVQELMGKLEQGLKEVFESDKYKEYLNTMSKFHNYSINNVLLINQQKPEATLVAGFNSWANNFDRHVKKGERGIKIIAPAPYTIKKEQPIIDMKTGSPILNADGSVKTTEVDVKIPAFKVTTVFDISQTYGKELPTIGVNELTGEVDRAKDFIESLKRTTATPIEFGETNGESKGFYSPTDNKIVIKEGMSDVQTIKTMIHEIAHSKLHNPEAIKEEGKGLSQGSKEVAAESVAYVVCQHFGIDTSDYSFAYIAGWSEGKSPEELKENIQTIRDTAAEMINRVEGNLRAIDHDREKAAEAEKGNIPMEKDPDFVVIADTADIPFAENIPEANIQTEKAETKTEEKTEKQPSDAPIAEKPDEAKADEKKTKDTKETAKPEKKSLKAKLSEKKKEVSKGIDNKTKSKEQKKGDDAR